MRQTTRRSPDWRLRQPLTHPMISTSVFWGPGPDPVTAVKAVFADLSDQFAQRQQLAANSISRDDAAKLLGIAAHSVTAKLASRKLVGIEVGRESRLPTCNSIPTFPSSSYPIWTLCKPCFPGAGEPIAVDAEFSAGIRRAKCSRGDDPSRQCTSHRTRPGFDRHRMVRKLGRPTRPLPKAPFVWWWEPRREGFWGDPGQKSDDVSGSGCNSLAVVPRLAPKHAHT